MAYVKRVLAGLVASAAMLAVLYSVGILVAFGLEQIYNVSAPPGGSFFVEWHINFWLILIAALAAFSFGFYWQLRRSAHNLRGTQI
jgi:uncharacterized RDD family membrane protein YckC